MLCMKKLEIKPIKITLPQVKKIVEWNPIIKSVKKKLKIKAGINFNPKIAGM